MIIFSQNQLPMRSYGRPNYSRGSSLPRLNDEVECSPNQHFFPSHYNGLQQPLHTASFTQPPAMNPLGCGNNNARPCVSFISPTTTTTPLASHGMSSPHHLPDSINGIKPISELERLTNRVGFEVGSSELPTRLRYTLADKLNMSTSAFHWYAVSTFFHSWFLCRYSAPHSNILQFQSCICVPLYIRCTHGTEMWF